MITDEQCTVFFLTFANPSAYTYCVATTDDTYRFITYLRVLSVSACLVSFLYSVVSTMSLNSFWTSLLITYRIWPLSSSCPRLSPIGCGGMKE